MKKYLMVLITLALMLISSINVFAGTWKQDTVGWWYENNDGSYTKNAWQTIDGQEYYFNAEGYLLVNTTTPDGFVVNADGVKIAKATDNTASSNGSVKKSSTASSQSSSGGTCYIPASGKKYHAKPNCGKMNPSKAREVTVQEAKSMGYGACSKCY